MHIRNLNYFTIGIRSKWFCGFSHQEISPHFIIIKIQDSKQYQTLSQKTCLCFQFRLDIIIKNNDLWQIISSKSVRTWSSHLNWRMILLRKIWCYKSIVCLRIYTFWYERNFSNWWKWGWKSLCWWGVFLRRFFFESLTLSETRDKLPNGADRFRIYGIDEAPEKVRDPNTFIVIFNHIFGTWMNFYRLTTHHFTVLWQSKLLLLVMINLSFPLSQLHQIVFYLTWLSYPSPHQGWFDTIRRNRLILV